MLQNKEDKAGNTECTNKESMSAHKKETRREDIQIVHALLRLGPLPTCRETRRLLQSLDTKPIGDIYNMIFSLSKATNKELVHYLGVVLEYPFLSCISRAKDGISDNGKVADANSILNDTSTLSSEEAIMKSDGINLELLVNLKLTAQDRYMSQAIHTYFSLIEKVYDFLSQDERLKIFYRYIYVFTSHACLDISLFGLFCRILEKDFFLRDLFLKKQFFTNFPFFKEFLVKFAPFLGDEIIKIGYENPNYRRLIFYLTKSKIENSKIEDRGNYNGETVHDMLALNWIRSRWGVPAEMPLPSLFYLFDCSPLLEDLGLLALQSCENPLFLIKEDLIFDESNKSCQFFRNAKLVRGFLEKKENLLKSCDAFNRTGKLSPDLSPELVRLLPALDLKVLGGFLGKEKSFASFLTFTHTFSFRGVPLLEAFRTFMSSFSLPGESQIISRAVDVFSIVYILQNSSSINNGDRNTMGIDRDSANAETINENHPLFREKEKCRKLAFGFLVLNTMFFNPSIDKKPSFEDYLTSAEFIEDEKSCFIMQFSKDEMKEFYESIREFEMKVPLKWTDSFDKFVLFKSLNLQGSFPVFNDTIKNNAVIDNIESNDNKIANNKVGNAIGDKTCRECSLRCYRILFKRSAESFVFLPPEVYFEICDLLGLEEQFGRYVLNNRKDSYKTVEGCKLFFENFAILPDSTDDGMKNKIFGTNEAESATEKTATQVLSALWEAVLSICSAGSKGIFTKRNEPPGDVLSEVGGMKFKSEEILKKNLFFIEREFFMKESPGEEGKKRQVFNKIVLTNFSLLENFTSFDVSVQLEVLHKNSEKYFDFVSHETKMKFLISEFEKENFSEFYHKKFLEEVNCKKFPEEVDQTKRSGSIDTEDHLGDNNEKDSRGKSKMDDKMILDDDQFTAFCLLQQKFDDFEKFVRVEKINGKFLISEKFVSSAEKIKKLFNFSNSVLNLKFVKKIHRDGCPLKIKEFGDFDRISYLLLKCNSGGQSTYPLLNDCATVTKESQGEVRALTEYAACVMNFMSDSLVLFVDLFEYIYPVLFQISREFSGILIKILIKRIKNFREGGMACCEDYQSRIAVEGRMHKDSTSPYMGFSTTLDSNCSFKIKKLVQRLVHDQFLDLKAVPLPGLTRARPESFEL